MYLFLNIIFIIVGSLDWITFNLSSWFSLKFLRLLIEEGEEKGTKGTVRYKSILRVLNPEKTR